MGAIVLYDGLCGFCDASVQWLLARDKSEHLRFAALQSDAASALLQEHGLSNECFDSIVCISGDTVYTKSTAACMIASELAPPWHHLALLRYIPRPIRDLGYDVIAALRYRFAGRRDSCRLPTPAERARFL